MTGATDAQTDRILTLANKLTGQGARYVSQSSVLDNPRRGWTKPEASALIDELQAAIEDEAQRRKGGAVDGARVTFAYKWRDGETTQVTGTIDGYKWSDLHVSMLRMTGLDDATKAKAGKDTVLCVVERVSGLREVGAAAASGAYEVYLTDTGQDERVASLTEISDQGAAHDLCVALQPYLREGIEAHFARA